MRSSCTGTLDGNEVVERMGFPEAAYGARL